MKAKAKVTINDIAKAAGVSTTTVSRYINGKEELMSEQTRNRIKTVIELLDYHPSDIARSLRNQKSNMIGVLIADVSSPFSSAIIIGIERVLVSNGYTPLFLNCSENKQREEQYIRSLIFKKVDGLIVNTTSADNKFLISLACQGFPIVLCDRFVRDYNFNIVTNKDNEMIRSFVMHLKEQGFTRLAFFVQPWSDNSTRYRRRDAFFASVHEIYGYLPENDIYVIDVNDKDCVIAQLKKFLSSLSQDDIPAIIGTNSVSTMCVYKAITKLGLSMPDDIGLCGPDDWDWNNGMNWPEIVHTNITTATIYAQELGERAAKLLLERIAAPDELPSEILLPNPLVIRDSTLRIRNK